MKRGVFIIGIVLSVLISSTSCVNKPSRFICGSYTDSTKNGLSIIDVNLYDDSFKIVSESDAGPNPSYFAISEKFQHIFAANEVMNFNGIDGGGITTLKLDKAKGVAVKVSELPVPNGGPCFISLSAEEDFLFLANYMGGSVSVVKLNSDGIPEKVTDNILYEKEGEKVSHAHMIACDPEGKRVYVTDLGLDRIMIYELDRLTGKLKQIENGVVKLQEGAGPRHFIFNQSGTYMYVICELNSTVSVFSVNTKGELKPVQTISTLDDGFKGTSFCADIHLSNDGKFIYGSNRGENSIVTFFVAADGTLSVAGRSGCGGNWPRNFTIDPSGKNILVANQRSGNISVLRIDENTGVAIKTPFTHTVKSPACLKFLNL
jgi:6-phosphogluconolactonase